MSNQYPKEEKKGEWFPLKEQSIQVAKSFYPLCLQSQPQPR